MSQENATNPISRKKKKLPNLHLYQKEYQQYIAKAYEALSEFNPVLTEAFCSLIGHTDYKEIEKLPAFQTIRKKICPEISPQQAFRLAAMLPKTNNLTNLKYLIETCGFIDLFSITDPEDGNTLLHYLALHDKSAPFIEQFLNSYKINLNAKNKIGVTPMELAVLLGNSKVVIALRQQTHTKVALSGQKYSNLKTQSKHPSITTEAAVFKSGPDLLEQNKALFFKTLFSNKFYQLSFKQCFDFFKTYTPPASSDPSTPTDPALDPVAQELFCDAYLLSTNPFTIDHIDEFFTTYVETEKKVSPEVFINKLKTMAAWYTKKIDQHPNVIKTAEALNDIVLKFVDAFSDKSLSKISWHAEICHNYNNLGLFEKGKDTAECGLLKPYNDESRSNILKSLAESQQELLYLDQSNESLEKAFQLNSKSEEDGIFFLYFNSAITDGDYEKAKIICNKSNNQHAQLCLRFAKYKSDELSALEMLQELEKHASAEGMLKLFWLKFTFDCHLTLGNVEEACALQKNEYYPSEAVYKNDKNAFDLNRITPFTRACSMTGKYQEGLDFLKSCENKYPESYKRSFIVKSIQFTFCLSIGQLETAEKLSHEFSQANINPDFKYYFWKNLALQQEEPLKKLHFLERALEILPDAPEAKIYKELLLSLSENEYPKETDLQSEIISLADIDEAAQQTLTNLELIEKTTSLMEENAEDLNNPANWDPKQIHTFYQEQKKNALLALQNSLSRTPPQPKVAWKVGETVYREGDPDLFSLNSPLYPDHFVTIDRSLMFDKKYHQTLEKGLCNRATDKDGLKILCNTLSELKMGGINERLYTLKKYQNGNKYLLVLNETGNHLKIKRELKLHKNFEIIDVSSISENFLPSGLSDHIDNKNQKPFCNNTDSNNELPANEPTDANSFSPVLTATAKPTKSLKNNEEKDDKRDYKDNIASNSLGN